MPGLLIEKLQPTFLKKALSQLPDGVIVVTGTNGKTTVTKIISELLEDQGKTVVTNATGSNFVRGVITVVCSRMSWQGRLNADVAVLELDEAHAVRFVEKFQPTGVVALNVLRDQLDRFGEIDKTAELIGQVVSASKSWVVLNANDPRIAGLQDKATGQVVWFGYDKTLTGNFVSDDQHHHGVAKTHFEAHTPDICLKAINNEQIEIAADEERAVVSLQLQGNHNALNAVAAVAAVHALTPGSTLSENVEGLDRVLPAFGRGEVVGLDNGSTLTLQLVKNPSGFTHNLEHARQKKYDHIGIVINDDFADSRDVSWLWDVSFNGIGEHAEKVLCGGTRGADMALRLKYDDVEAEVLSDGLSEFLSRITSETANQSVIFCTYTAMLRLRKLLKKHSKSVSEVKL